MKVSIHTSIVIDRSEEIQSSIDLPPDEAEKILRTIRSTTEPFVVGIADDVMVGSADYQLKCQVRYDAVGILARSLARHLIGQIGQRDTLNGYPIEIEGRYWEEHPEKMKPPASTIPR